MTVVERCILLITRKPAQRAADEWRWHYFLNRSRVRASLHVLFH
jgi:hypothetical protein